MDKYAFLENVPDLSVEPYADSFDDGEWYSLIAGKNGVDQVVAYAKELIADGYSLINLCGDFGEEHVVAYDTYSLAFQALLNDQVDCIVLDDAVGKAYLKLHPELVMVQTTYDVEGYAFGVYKQDTGLLEAINAALNELIADGTVDSIIAKWMAE